MATEEERREAVIHGAAAVGYGVTPLQLARWHRAGLLPKPRQHPLGRGRGTETRYPPGTLLQVVALCRLREEERRLDRLAFQLWWEGFSIDVGLVRAHLVGVASRFDREVQELHPELPLTCPQSPVEGLFRRTFGKRRVEALAGELKEAIEAGGHGGLPIAATLLEFPSPPKLEDFSKRIAQVMATALSGGSAAEFVKRTSDTELTLARERTRSMLAVVRDIAGPMAWLNGKAGSLFRLMDQWSARIEPSDLPTLLVGTLLLMPLLPQAVVSLLDGLMAPPVLPAELRTILAIRDSVPGADEIFTPMAMRALLRGKEAAGRHRSSIQAFVKTHQDEINEVIRATSEASGSGQAAQRNPSEQPTANPSTPEG